MNTFDLDPKGLLPLLRWLRERGRMSNRAPLRPAGCC